MISKLAVIDFETTGQDPREHQVIEAAIVSVQVLPDGQLGDVVEKYESLNDPGYPIPEMITRLTGIDDSMVRGQKTDWMRFVGICSRANLLVAHNARFDRSFLEGQTSFRSRHWACSSSMIDWKSVHGMPCGHLKHLAWEHQYYPKPHRALADVETVIHLLRLPSRGLPSQTYFQEMYHCATRRHFLVSANDSPYDSKRALKENRFRWSSKSRVWWKVVPEDKMEKLELFLRQKVYMGEPKHTKIEVDPLDPAVDDT